jgi:Tol biopolymer transport system component
MENLPSTATDGVRIFSSVIENGRTVLSEISIADGDVLRLSVPNEIAAPSLGDLSPDGTKLLLRSHLSPESEQSLWVVPVNGGSALRVANILAHDATWMPNGNSILYAAGNELLVTHLKDGSSSSIAALPGRAFWLRWSPDAHLLRFTIIDPIGHTMSLWELPAGSHSPRPVLPGWSNPASDCCGAWTADGKYFVFQSAHDGSDDLWLLRGKDLSGATRLTNGPLRYEAPVAARSGHRIFFLGLDTQSALQRYSVEKKEFVPENDFLSLANRVDYSRDRQWVAWTDAQGQLWRARIDGSQKLQLTPDSMQVLDLHTHIITPLPGSEGLFSPRWSPDGRYIAAISLDQRNLMLFDVANRTWRLLAQTSVADPVWSADSSAIYIHAFMADTQPIYRVEIPSGHLQQVADLASFRAGEAADYFFCGVTPDNVPLVRARSSTGNLYSLDLGGK